MDTEIKRAGNTDFKIIHEMAEVVFRETYKTILSAEQMEYMMEWMYSLPNLAKQVAQGHTYYIAWNGDDALGYVSVRKDSMDPDGTEVWHLEKIYVMPSAQGTGLGYKLLETAKQHVRDNKSTAKARIELNVNRNNPAVGFYKKLGLTILRQGDFPIGNGYYMNDYIMGLTV
ncbi:MAG: GNAT family N-acetyltransferase [Bacteroidaceae bacterium]|nr:GNAT family N-acetyltransferase [Bacteroidaceae bacterium]